MKVKRGERRIKRKIGVERISEKRRRRKTGKKIGKTKINV